MKIYRAKQTIEHGEDNGSVIVYQPGDEVPGKLARALPGLVDVTEIANVERIKPAKQPGVEA